MPDDMTGVRVIKITEKEAEAFNVIVDVLAAAAIDTKDLSAATVLTAAAVVADLIPDRYANDSKSCDEVTEAFKAYDQKIESLTAQNESLKGALDTALSLVEAS